MIKMQDVYSNDIYKITLLYPENKSKVDARNEDVCEFLNGYSEGLSLKYAYKGDNYAPKSIMLKWRANVSVPFTVTVWKAGNEKKCEIYATNESFLVLDMFFDKEEYFWCVEAISEGQKYESPVYSFTVNACSNVFLLDGVSNTRDIGGFLGLDGKKIAYGKVFRGASLDKITERGKRFARNTLGIKTDLDLRNEDELKSSGSPLGGKIQRILASGSMYTGNKWSSCEYTGREGIDIEEGQRKLVKGLSVFANENNYPIYIHCVLGRDRTGTLISVLLALCGVSKKDIMMDYELSFFSSSGCGEKTDIISIIGYVNKVFDYLGGFEGDNLQQQTVSFLKSAGMSEEQIFAIQKNLLV